MMSDPINLDGKELLPPSAVKPIGLVSLVRREKKFVTTRVLHLAKVCATNWKLAGDCGTCHRACRGGAA